MKALNGSLRLVAVASIAFLVAAVGCSDSDKDESGNDTNAAGENNAGTAGSTAGKGGSENDGKGGDDAGKGGETQTPGGSPAGGADSAGGADNVGGAGGAPGLVFGEGGDSSSGGAGDGGPTVAKFCNDLSYGEDHLDTTMVLTVGEGTEQVTFEATTGECVPIDCKDIPTGEDVLIEMFDIDDTTAALDSGTVTIKSGQDWIFFSTTHDFGSGKVPVWDFAKVKKDVATCAEITYDDVYSSE